MKRTQHRHSRVYTFVQITENDNSLEVSTSGKCQMDAYGREVTAVLQHSAVQLCGRVDRFQLCQSDGQNQTRLFLLHRTLIATRFSKHIYSKNTFKVAIPDK
jgi:hypothetical protein